MRKVKQGQISNTEILQAYQAAFGVTWWQTLFGLVDFELADQTYVAADVEKIEAILAKDMIEQEEYHAEEFDCDDFAFALMGAFHHNRDTAAMPIFITWVNTPRGGHAVISYYHEGVVKIIEPQNDKIFDIPKDWSLMMICG